MLISCSGSPGIIFIKNINNCGYHDGFIKLENYENKVKKNFLKYLFIRNKEKLVSKANGSVFKNLNAQLINNFVINLPDLEIQNKIISIIEPHEDLFRKYHSLIRIDSFEHCKEDLNKIISIIEPFEKLNQSITSFLKILKIIIRNISLLDSTKIIDTFYNLEIRFIKGILPQSEWFSNLKSKIPFINVACINNNPNKFIKNQFINEINVYYGDIILSLDATIGLVNNFLYGINGYGYKIKSEKWPNYLIYFSLLTNINQDIIKKHAKGTTILHASEAKKFICLLDNEKFNQIIRTLFELDLYFKKIKNALEKIINNLIKYLII